MAIKSTRLALEGMNCASCVAHIEQALKELPGVRDARVNFALNKGEVDYDDEQVGEHDLVAAVAGAGYRASVLPTPGNTTEHLNHHKGEDVSTDHGAHAGAESSSELLSRWRRFLSAALLSVGVVALSFVIEWENERILMLLLSFAVLNVGREFFTLGLPGLWRLRPNMDTLVALGVGSAFIYSSFTTIFAPTAPEYFMDVAVITTFILFGRYLEARAKGRASAAIRKLLTLTPKIAHRLGEDGRIEDVPVDHVVVGNQLVVKPGEQVPTDGIVLGGMPTIDESMVTGESIPVDKEVGDRIIGGTLNGNVSFTMRADQVGAETLLAQIVRLVEAAQMSKAPIQKLVDIVSGYFVWAVMAAAALTAGGWLAWSGDVGLALVQAVTVLVIACPCALGLATPISMVVGTGRGAELGILIKRAEALEKMKKITVVAFDKTGTITKGHPEVQEWVGVHQEAEAYFAELYTLESRSEHPLARAVVTWLHASRHVSAAVAMSGVAAVAGRGMTGEYGGVVYRVGSPRFLIQQGVSLGAASDDIERYQSRGYTVVTFARAHELLGYLTLQDGVKESSVAAVKELKRRGIRTVMVTGDNTAVAGEIARQVGIDEVTAEVMPADKAEVIRHLQADGQFVAMIGDGINDSPALAQANVGIAMGTGTDVAMETGDVVLVKGDLMKAVEAIELSWATLRNIKQNLFWAFFYNVVGIPIAALGYLSPEVSAAAMALSSVSVVCNALRLKKMTLHTAAEA